MIEPPGNRCHADLQGEVYFVELGPTRGKELDRKRRPVVVVSVDEINSKPLVAIVIPGKTRQPNKPPFRNKVLIEPSGDNGLENPTLFQAFQIKALDHARFDRPAVGKLPLDDLDKIFATLKLCLGLL